jgi:hypothetical protein
MKNNKYRLEKLYSKRQDLILEGINIDEINSLIREEENAYSEYLKENTSAPGGPGAVSSGVAFSTGVTLGMGAATSPQASSYAGVTTEPGYSAGGGEVGTTISMPYSTSISSKDSPKRIISQKDPLNKGRKDRRNSKMLTGLKAALKSRKQDFTAKQAQVPNFSAPTTPKSSKILSWDNFTKDNLNKVTKVKENKK